MYIHVNEDEWETVILPGGGYTRVRKNIKPWRVITKPATPSRPQPISKGDIAAKNMRQFESQVDELVQRINSQLELGKRRFEVYTTSEAVISEVIAMFRKSGWKIIRCGQSWSFT